MLKLKKVIKKELPYLEDEPALSLVSSQLLKDAGDFTKAKKKCY